MSYTAHFYFTAIKHQLRVHLADGIDCPILGDHKYSHFGKLAPQILPAKILRRFGIPHSKSRYIPMHLHLKSILIPGKIDNVLLCTNLFKDVEQSSSAKVS